VSHRWRASLRQRLSLQPCRPHRKGSVSRRWPRRPQQHLSHQSGSLRPYALNRLRRQGLRDRGARSSHVGALRPQPSRRRRRDGASRRWRASLRQRLSLQPCRPHRKGSVSRRWPLHPLQDPRNILPSQRDRRRAPCQVSLLTVFRRLREDRGVGEERDSSLSSSLKRIERRSPRSNETRKNIQRRGQEMA
jgi:hypothetical protein